MFMVILCLIQSGDLVEAFYMSVPSGLLNHNLSMPTQQSKNHYIQITDNAELHYISHFCL